MRKISVESMVLAGQVKISWRCQHCSQIEERVASTLDGVQ